MSSAPQPLPNQSDPSAVFQTILESLPDPVFVKDEQHRWIYVNEAFCQLLGHHRNGLLGRSDFDTSPEAEARVFWAKDAEVFETGLPNVNLERHTDLHGRTRIIETKKSLAVIGGRPYLVGIIRDLTVLTEIQGELARANQELERRVSEQTAELSRSNAQLQNMAFFDPLTALPNRRLLISSLERRLQAGPVAIFYLDLDHFKRANDSYGHPFGDAMLSALSERMRSFRQFSMVARVGGDEFVALSADTTATDRLSLGQLCRSVLEQLSKPFVVDGIETSISASIGVAVAPTDGRNVIDLLQHADNAMFNAKERGRNQYAFFTAEMNVRAKENVDIERGLRRAIRAGEIEVYFQPLVNAKTGKVVGVEALARWNDAELGQVGPDRFVPIAESSGLIHELSHLVLRRALRLAKLHLPADQRLCVNLSALQLDRMTLVEDVRRALQETDFPASRLELEITESVATNRGDRLVQVLESMRDLGISFALDDFGTGYSALAQVQRLPIDRVKIDRSFITNIDDNPRSRSLVEAMIRMAHVLDLRVLAEGVERLSQLRVLRELGCDEVQGYLLGRPRDLQEL